MYISISPQKQGGNYQKSSGRFVAYLEKENEEGINIQHEYFFNQNQEHITPEHVVQAIDQNTAKLKAKEPKFYSITISPSQRELGQLQNNSKDLKAFTRVVMKDYVTCFNRELDGRPIAIKDILYFAKVEHQRTYKGTDIQVRENQPYATKILKLHSEIRKIRQGSAQGRIQDLAREIARFEQQKIYTTLDNSQLGEQEKQSAFAKSFDTLNKVNFSLLIDSIAEITTPAGETVTDREQIIQFCNHTDAKTIDEIQEKLSSLRLQAQIKPLMVKATEEQIKKGVPASFEVPLTFDNSNFFG